MPKEIPGLPDEVLRRELENLSGILLITPRQAGMILSRSPKQLSDDRAAGRPPPFAKIGGSNRYTIGAVRDYILSNVHRNTSQATLKRANENAGLSVMSFMAFMHDGKKNDQWPFMIESCNPIEFFFSLAIGVSEEAQCQWLSLDEYLEMKSERVDAVFVTEQINRLEGVATSGGLRRAPKLKPPL